MIECLPPRLNFLGLSVKDGSSVMSHKGCVEQELVMYGESVSHHLWMITNRDNIGTESSL